MNLEGDAGAKSVIGQHAKDLRCIDFPAGAQDIDTISDYHSVQ